MPTGEIVEAVGEGGAGGGVGHELEVGWQHTHHERGAPPAQLRARRVLLLRVLQPLDEEAPGLVWQCVRVVWRVHPTKRASPGLCRGVE